MKGEYAESAHHHHHHHHHQQAKHETSPINMFSKLHPHHHHHLPFSHHFPLSREHEDDDTRSPGGAAPAVTTLTTATAAAATAGTVASTPTDQKQKTIEPNSSDGATIEVVRRPRGRPPGSKNKPKPPVVITRDPEPVMSPYILEIPGGTDVVDAIFRFCRLKSIGICVLTGSGTVANVTLRQPSSTPGATITFHGRFDILSISATFLPETVSYPVPNTFTISLAGPQGQIVGGLVAGSLIAAGTVYVIAATFNNPIYHRLLVDDEGKSSGSGGGGGEGNSPAVSGGESGQTQGGGGGGGGGGGESCGGMVMYNCNLPSDVIWAPSARPPPPPPY